jgi:hypothetical protein
MPLILTYKWHSHITQNLLLLLSLGAEVPVGSNSESSVFGYKDHLSPKDKGPNERSQVTTSRWPSLWETARTEAYEGLPNLTKIREDAQCSPKWEALLIITGLGQ